MEVTPMQQLNDSSASGAEFGRPAPTRIYPHPEEQEPPQFTPEEQQTLGAVYQLLADVAQRAREQERAA